MTTDSETTEQYLTFVWSRFLIPVLVFVNLEGSQFTLCFCNYHLVQWVEKLPCMSCQCCHVVTVANCSATGVDGRRKHQRWRAAVGKTLCKRPQLWLCRLWRWRWLEFPGRNLRGMLTFGVITGMFIRLFFCRFVELAKLGSLKPMKSMKSINLINAAFNINQNTNFNYQFFNHTTRVMGVKHSSG